MKKSQLQEAIDRIQNEINERMRALDVLEATRSAMLRVKPKATRKPKAQEPTT